jgi:dihydrofolate reductase
MRKLILKMSMSLDGFVARPNGELDWMFANSSPEGRAWTVAQISDASLHIMGAKTFRDMVAWWPYSQEVFAEPMNTVPKAVFTRKGAASLAQTSTTQAINDANAALEKDGGKKKAADPAVLKGWADAYVATGPIADEIARLKQQNGEPIIAHGGAGFARSLIATGLVDQYALAIFPVVLGKGLPIFTETAKRISLELVSSQAFPKGGIGNIYRAK